MITIGGCSALMRADLGDGDLEVGEHLQQIGLERLVGAVELVDQQHGRPGEVGLQRLQQRPADQEALGEDVLAPDCLAVGGPAASASRISSIWRW